MAERHEFRVIHPVNATELEAAVDAARGENPPLKKGFLRLVLAPPSEQQVPRPTESTVEVLMGRTTYTGGEDPDSHHIAVIEGGIPANPTVKDVTITFPEDPTQQAIVEIITVSSPVADEDQ
jgi:hypothetical protein